MSTPTPQPGKSTTLEQQLDELLMQIETVEPGTVDASTLPESFKAQQAEAETESANSDDAADAEIEAILNAEPAPTQGTVDEPPAAQEADPEQADMLAALNSALQGISNNAPKDTQAEPEPEPEPTAAAAIETTAPADEAMSMEDKLQQEIASLMSAEPESAATQDRAIDSAGDDDILEGSFESPENLAVATQEPSANGPSTEDQIAMEIEGLLNPSKSADAEPPQASADTAIDDLDKMLAQEIDDDDELAGDFQSVEDATAGIKIENNTQQADDDEHAATAREVAAELDSQPEDLPAPPSAAAAVETGEDPFAILSEIAETAEQNEAAHHKRLGMQSQDWKHLLEVSKERLLNVCFLLNWPARRFLTAEWRANLGYIALLNLFFGVGLWIVLIVF